MNKLRSEAAQYAEVLRSATIPEGIQPFVIPPHTAIDVVAKSLSDTRVLVGAQNAHWAASDAWTGEVSMAMVLDAGAKLVELGHSERRANFGDTDERVAAKVNAALTAGLTPLLCVGEPEEVRAEGGSAQWVRQQLDSAFSVVGAQGIGRSLIAYEPIWAIGEHGREARPEEVAPVYGEIARWAADVGVTPLAVLYGGSVNPGNLAELLSIDGVGGAFIGRSAWSPNGFLRLMEIAAPFS